MSGAVDWRAVAGILGSVRPSELMPRLVESVASLEGGEVWLWDHQRRSLAAVGSGVRIARDALEARAGVSRPLRHLGRDLGFVTLEIEATEDELDRLAALIGTALAAGDTVEDTTRRLRRTEEMSLPAQIQWELLPATERTIGEVTLTAAIEPAYDTGGDVFDHALDGDRLSLAVLDARGHGLRAASLSAVAAAAMRRARLSRMSLEEIASEIDGAVNALDEDEFVSAVLVELDLRTWRGTWLTAGHRPPLVVADGTVSELPVSPCLPLGMSIDGDRPEPRVHGLDLAAGEALVLYSDGIVENIDLGTEAMVGDAVFHAALAAVLLDRRREHVARAVVESLLGYTGPVIRDDATLLVVQRAG